MTEYTQPVASSAEFGDGDCMSAARGDGDDIFSSSLASLSRSGQYTSERSSPASEAEVESSCNEGARRADVGDFELSYMEVLMYSSTVGPENRGDMKLALDVLADGRFFSCSDFVLERMRAIAANKRI